RAEKVALVRAVPAAGAVVLNADDPRVLSMRDESRARVITASARGGTDVSAVGPIDETSDGIAFALDIAGARRAVRLRLAGRHNAINALVAAGVGWAAGLGPDQIAAGLEAARPAKGRCVWRRAGPVQLLDDTYNANPPSVRAALETLS